MQIMNISPMMYKFEKHVPCLIFHFFSVTCRGEASSNAAWKQESVGAGQYALELQLPGCALRLSAVKPNVLLVSRR
jgi:hypothetical protein